jgi:uncharacterized protein YecT (DUF1311 family)
MNMQNNSPTLVADQRRWLMLRNRNCNKAESRDMRLCLIEMTKARIAGLAAVISAMQDSGE